MNWRINHILKDLIAIESDQGLVCVIHVQEGDLQRALTLANQIVAGPAMLDLLIRYNSEVIELIKKIK